MHIPDGFLAPPVWLSLNVASAVAVAGLARRAQRQTQEARVPLLGIMGAFVFAAQMINFPVGLGTSGHLLGGVVLAVTLGPAPAAMVMTAILVIQALVFQDGGVLALGANVFNMALAGVLAGYLPFALWGGGRLRSPAIVAGGVLSVTVSAGLAMAELAVSGVAIPATILWASAGLFLVNGILEGLITVTVVVGLERFDRDLLRKPARGWTVGKAVAAAVATALAGVGVLFASQAPDVLENLAERVDIAGQARDLITTPLADYQVRGLKIPWVSQALAGLAGLALIYAALLAVSRLLLRRRGA